jgi:RNA polymerase sigma-70 factor (ECF subfamily)
MTMPTEGPFRELIGRVRSGDEQAAVELVRRYEPAIRRAARIRLRDQRLVRLLDSMDICQSVLASFFVRAAMGQYELETPEQLLGLLVKMARNKVSHQGDAERAGRRDHRRVVAAIDGSLDVAACGASPSRQVSARELLDEGRRLLSPDERALLERREQGGEWAAIAAELGGSPDALRIRLARAVDRVARRLGLDEDGP